MPGSKWFAAVVVIVLLGFTAVSAVDQKSIFESVELTDGFTILQVALKEANLDVMLSDEKRKFTLLAPNDAAFKKLGEEQIKNIVADKNLLKKILLAHIVEDKALTSTNLKTLDDVNGFRISMADGLKIGDAKLVKSDIPCKNGLIHTIDTVLIPK